MASAKLIAQSIWLYLNTFLYAVEENPYNDSEHIEKIIHINENDTDLDVTFYHSTYTDRWWFEIPNTKITIAISKDDYLAVQKGRIPDRIIKILKKFV